MEHQMERWTELFEICPDGLFLVDTDRTIRAMNPAMERLTGWSASEAVGKEVCQELFCCNREGGDGACLMPCPGLRAIKGYGPTHHAELVFRSRDGRKRVVAASYNRMVFEGRPCALGVLKEITENKEREQLMTADAFTDPITGWMNLRPFLRRLEEEFHRARRHLHPFSLLLMEIDGGRLIKEQRGASVFERILTEVAHRIAQKTRSCNILARYGESELALLLPETGRRAAIRAAVRLRREVAHAALADAAIGGSRRPTVSIGVASFPLDGEEPSDCLRAAEQALEMAKVRGRDRVGWVPWL